MISEEVKSLNELIDKVRKGEIEGVEVVIGKNNVTVKRKDDIGQTIKAEVKKEIQRVRFGAPDLSHADFSNTDVSGSNFYGLDLHEADFSYANIEQVDMAKTYLKDTNFYHTRVSQTNLYGAFEPSMGNAYMTGSVNLAHTAKDGWFYR